MGRLIAIGDIHGHPLALHRLLHLLQPQPEDTIVTLGDYVSRGPDSRGVLEILLGLRDCCQDVPILGNHDEMMIDLRQDPYAADRLRTSGFRSPLDSYGDPGTIDDVPKSHWDFLDRCVPFFETERFIFTHANYCWYSPLVDQPSDLLRWTTIEQEAPQPHVSGKTVVVGHSPGEIRDQGFCLCLDTGCGVGGKLTAMDLDARNVWQVAEDGVTEMTS